MIILLISLSLNEGSLNNFTLELSLKSQIRMVPSKLAVDSRFSFFLERSKVMMESLWAFLREWYMDD